MKIPAINLEGVINLLRKEGSNEILECSIKPGTFNGITGTHKLLEPVIKEWDDILRILEREVVPLLENGCEASQLTAPAIKLSTSAAKLSLCATKVLSFVPGPIGIVCSLINAIVFFSMGDIPMGLLELLGCFPGAKMGVKGGSKLMSEVGKEIMSAISKNTNLLTYLKKIKITAKEFNPNIINKKISELTTSLSASANSTKIVAKAPAKVTPKLSGEKMTMETIRISEEELKRTSSFTISAHQIEKRGIDMTQKGMNNMGNMSKSQLYPYTYNPYSHLWSK